MLLPGAKLENSEVRGRTGGAVLPSSLTAGFFGIGAACVVSGYAGDVLGLRIAGIAAFSILALITWLAAIKRYRAIADTPTTLLRSAAQGYVEITGTCRAIPFADLLRPGKLPPCAWYYARIEKKRTSGGERHVHFESSYEKFLIEDGTGECVIDPAQAEVLSAHQTSWEDADAYYTVRYLLPGDRLYAIGDMRTLRAADGSLIDDADLSAVLRREWKRDRRRADLGALLREWKRDRAALVQQYDSDGDGVIDLQEWQGVMAAAEREVDARHGEPRPKSGLHVMGAPGDGRPFLLSNSDPDDLRQRYKWGSWIPLAWFIAASVWGMTVLLNQPH